MIEEYEALLGAVQTQFETKGDEIALYTNEYRATQAKWRSLLENNRRQLEALEREKADVLAEKSALETNVQ